MDNLYEIGLQAVVAIQSLGSGLNGPMQLASFLGRTEFYLLLIPFIYWNVNTRLAFRTLLVLISVELAGATLKQLLQQPRPYWIADVEAYSTEPTYGAPSSHASDSLAIAGYLGLHFKKPWVWGMVAILVILIGLSRLYLGVHFPHDVLMGWALGLGVLIAFVKLAPNITARVRKWSLSSQVVGSSLVSILIVIVFRLIQLSVDGASDPPAWASFSVGSRSLTYAFTLAGAFFGGVLGYALMKRYARFREEASWLLKLVRYALGTAGVVALFFGLDALFASIAPDESALGFGLRYLRYASVSLWATFIAPWIFLKLKLAQPAKK